MRMRGLEPPPGCPDTDLNRARLPIPPHPRADEQAKIAHRKGMGGPARGSGFRASHRLLDGVGLVLGALLASSRIDRAPLSSRGLGRRPLMAETRVRIPVAVLVWPRVYGALRFLGPLVPGFVPVVLAKSARGGGFLPRARPLAPEVRYAGRKRGAQMALASRIRLPRPAVDTRASGPIWVGLGH